MSGDPGLASPPAVPAVLSEAGVASAGEASRARLSDLSRSHSVTLAELPDGSAYVVKRLSAQARESGRSLAAELFAYRLASWHPELAAVMPEPVHLDERNHVLALAAGRPEHLFPSRRLEPGFPAPDLAAALGRALAVLHTETRGLPLPGLAACGTVFLPDVDPGERQSLGVSPGAEGLVDAVIADERLAASLRRTAAVLRPACLVHADVKWDNALLLPGPPARVLLFDWELSGHGDPAWDVGSALADTVVLAMRLRGAAALESDPVEWLSPSLRALLGACGQADDEGLAERVSGCWVARIVHLAIECAIAIDAPDAADHPAVLDLLGIARRLADRHDSVADAVDDALSAGA